MSEENLTGKCFLYNHHYQLECKPPIDVNDKHIYSFHETDYEFYVNESKTQNGKYSLYNYKITLIDQNNKTYYLDYDKGNLIDDKRNKKYNQVPISVLNDLIKNNNDNDDVDNNNNNSNNNIQKGNDTWCLIN
jgi:hypothetical protein